MAELIPAAIRLWWANRMLARADKLDRLRIVKAARRNIKARLS